VILAPLRKAPRSRRPASSSSRPRVSVCRRKPSACAARTRSCSQCRTMRLWPHCSELDAQAHAQAEARTLELNQVLAQLQRLRGEQQSSDERLERLRARARTDPAPSSWRSMPCKRRRCARRTRAPGPGLPACPPRTVHRAWRSCSPWMRAGSARWRRCSGSTWRPCRSRHSSRSPPRWRGSRAALWASSRRLPPRKAARPARWPRTCVGPPPRSHGYRRCVPPARWPRRCEREARSRPGNH
jgi:hypothetical protein